MLPSGLKQPRVLPETSCLHLFTHAVNQGLRGGTQISWMMPVYCSSALALDPDLEILKTSLFWPWLSSQTLPQASEVSCFTCLFEFHGLRATAAQATRHLCVKPNEPPALVTLVLENFACSASLSGPGMCSQHILSEILVRTFG